MSPRKNQSTASAPPTKSAKNSKRHPDRTTAEIDPHWWISLTSLVKLDWRKHRTWITRKRSYATQQINLDGQVYRIEIINALSDDHAALELLEEVRYYTIPIEESETTPERHRLVLVREAHDFGRSQLYLIAVEPPGISVIQHPGAVGQIHIIGGSTDTEIATKEPHVIGVVDAVLVADNSAPATAILEPLDLPGPLETDSSPEPTTAAPIAATSSSESAAVASATAIVPPGSAVTGAPRAPTTALTTSTPSASVSDVPPAEARPVDSSADPAQASPLWDEELLNCIDQLNGIAGCHPAMARDVAEVQTHFEEYLHQKFGLESISITPNQTTYDPSVGHLENLDGKVSRLSRIQDGVITAVRRTGYKRQGQTVRPAEVIVNHHATQIVKFTKLASGQPGLLYAELTAPQEMLLCEIMPEAGKQLEALDRLCTLLSLYQAADGSTLRTIAKLIEQNQLTTLDMRRMLQRASCHPLRLSCLGRVRELHFSLRGEFAPLEAAREILKQEAALRETNNYYLQSDTNWISGQLHSMRSDAIQGLPRVELAPIGKTFTQMIVKLMGDITFAPDFVATTWPISSNSESAQQVNDAPVNTSNGPA